MSYRLPYKLILLSTITACTASNSPELEYANRNYDCKSLDNPDNGFTISAKLQADAFETDPNFGPGVKSLTGYKLSAADIIYYTLTRSSDNPVPSAFRIENIFKYENVAFAEKAQSLVFALSADGDLPACEISMNADFEGGKHMCTFTDEDQSHRAQTFSFACDTSGKIRLSRSGDL